MFGGKISRKKAVDTATTNTAISERAAKRRRIDAAPDPSTSSEPQDPILNRMRQRNPLIIDCDSSPKFPRTKLHNKLCSLDTGSQFAHQFLDAEFVLSELGPSAADWFWRCWMDGRVASRAETENWSAVPVTDTTSTTFLKSIEEWDFQLEDISASSSLNITPRVFQLVQLLVTQKSQCSTFRGVVVVQKPIIASMISELLQIMDESMEFIHPIVVIGSGSPQQRCALDSFGLGTYNLLIVTEFTEYLEIIPPSLIVWFNTYRRAHPPVMWQTPSNGCQAQMAYLVESDNDSHREILDHCSRLQMEYPSNSPNPGDQVLSIEDPTTCRKIFPPDAPGVLNRFAEALGAFNWGDRPLLLPTWDRIGPTTYRCTVEFPTEFKIPAMSTSHSNAMEAKRAVCFSACKVLFSLGLLDYRIFPPFPQDSGLSSELTDLKASESSIATRCYSKRTPPFWRKSLKLDNRKLYPNIITVKFSQGSNHSPIILLTRLPLPITSTFRIFCSGAVGEVAVRNAQAFVVDDEQLATLHGFTIRVARSVLNKPITFSLGELPYLFAPLPRGWKPPPENERWWNPPDVARHISWDVARLAAKDFVTPLVSGSSSLDDAADDAIIQDRWVEFTNRHFLAKVRHDMTPLSKPEEGIREEGHPSFLAYCEARRKDFSGLKDRKQSMVEVSVVPNAINYLYPFGKHIETSSRTSPKYLIPELCAKFSIPASTFRTAQILPSIMYRIEHILLVKELNSNLFGDAIEEELLLAAISSPSANVEMNYERLEFLGDAFLKYVASIHCLATVPEKREGQLHKIRQQIISNRALHTGVAYTGLPSYIQGKPFILKVWQLGSERATTHQGQESQEPGKPQSGDPTGDPPSDQTSGKRKKQQDEKDSQWLGDKTVADVVEAIIGAAYLSQGVDLALKVAQKLRVAIADVQNFSDFAMTFSKTGPGHTINLPQSTLKAIETIVGGDISMTLLAQALTHPSLQAPNLLPYDRLEFLGDATLDFIVVRYIFHRHRHLPPGGLTMLKAAMVTNSTLATICVLTGLHDYVQHSSPDLSRNIATYAETIRRIRDEEDKQSKAEGRVPIQFWAEVEAPKVLSDIVESVIGALLVSHEFSLVGVERFFDNILKPFFERYIRMETLSQHPNVTLYDLFHSVGCQQHKIAKEVNKDVIRCNVIVHDAVIATATGVSGNSTTREASTSALKALEGDPGLLTRICDCRAHVSQKKVRSKEQKVRLGYGHE